MPKQQKREEAEIRQEKYDNMTLLQKVELTANRRGLSKKERNRLVPDSK